MTAEFIVASSSGLSTLSVRFIWGPSWTCWRRTTLSAMWGIELAESCDPEQFHRFVGEHEADAEAGAALHQRVQTAAEAHRVGERL